MAVVTFERFELEKLVGMKLDKKYYKDVIPMIGAPLEELTDEEASFEIFPNRPDMLSIEGFARAVKHFLGLEEPKRYTATPHKVTVYVDKSVKEVRPFMVCAVVRDVEIDESLLLNLMQFQEKIHETFGRKRRKIAIGIHDFDMVKPPFYYKAVEPEEIKFVPLDTDTEMNLDEILRKHPKGIAYRHILENHKKYPILVDSDGSVLSFPPIINGELTRVTEKTKNLFIDITGTHLESLKKALNMLTTSLADRGYIVESVLIKDGEDFITPDFTERKIDVELNYVNKMLGTNLDSEKLIQLVKRMGFRYDNGILIPPYRVDIMHPIDIVEDIAIAYGYENFVPELPNIFTRGEPLKKREFENVISSILTGLMFQEVRTMILTSREDATENSAETLNPKSEECVVCREELIPGILRVFSQNKHVDYPQNIFEIGKVVFLSDTETGADERVLVCAAMSPGNYSKISSHLDEFMRLLKLEYKIIETEDRRFIPGRVGKIYVNGEEVGIIGEIHPALLNEKKVDKPVALFELDVDKLFKEIL